MIEDGFVFASSTTLRGQTVLRLCTINPSTTEDDILRSVRRIEQLGQQIFERIRKR
jgi:hypothetical protein